MDVTKFLLSFAVFLAVIGFAFGATSTTNTNTTVGNVAPTVGTVTVSPSPVDLTAGSTTDVQAQATITDENGYEDVQSCTAKWYNPSGTLEYTTSGTLSGGSGNTVTCTATQAFDYYKPAGTWNVTIEATDTASATGSNYTTFTVNELVALNLLNVPIEFGTTTVGSTNNPATSGKGYPLTTENYGNVNLTWEVKGTDLVGVTDNTKNITVSNVKYCNTTTGTKVALSTTFATYNPGAGYIAVYPNTGYTYDVYHWIDIPSGTYAQTYTGNYTVQVLKKV